MRRRVGTIRNAKIPARVVIGRRADYVACLCESEPPSVVRRILDHLQLAAVRAESKHSLLKIVPLAANLCIDTAIADGRVDPVVKSVAQVGNYGVGVPEIDTGKNDLSLVRLIIAVRVAQENHARAVGRDRAADHWKN